MAVKKQGRLTLTRRMGESLLIGGDVEVTVKFVSGRHVTLEICAPIECKILRKELAPHPTPSVLDQAS